jgi:hypothetical protein
VTGHRKIRVALDATISAQHSTPQDPRIARRDKIRASLDATPQYRRIARRDARAIAKTQNKTLKISGRE